MVGKHEYGLKGHSRSLSKPHQSKWVDYRAKTQKIDIQYFIKKQGLKMSNILTKPVQNIYRVLHPIVIRF